MARLIETVVLCMAILPYFGSGEVLAVKESAECTSEEFRPRYHFSPKKNWMNDPNGMVYYDGLYHMYFQYNPLSMGDGPKHWGHAISRDMSSWIEVQIAISPDELGAIWSGSGVVDFTNTTGFKQSPLDLDPIVAIYTSTGDRQRQSISYSVDGGFTFTKYAGNPVIDNRDLPDFRDPKVIWFDGKWVMSIGVQNRIEFYSSPDLKSWTREGEFGRDPEEGNHGGTWECPDLMSLIAMDENGNTTQLWVLFVSALGGAPFGGPGTQYFVGNFLRTANGLEFHTLPWSYDQWIDFGPDNYAGVTFSNEPKGRKIYIGWMGNPMYAGATPNVAHRGQMTIPRVLGLRSFSQQEGKYRLTTTPVPELTNLRDPSQYYKHPSQFYVFPDSPVELTRDLDFSSPTMELEINLEMASRPNFTICAHNNVSESTCFGFDRSNWILDRTKSGNIGFNDGFERSSLAYAPREVTQWETTIRIFLDVSSIEVFADDGLTTMTALHFPTQPFDKLTISHSSPDSIIFVNRFEIWGLKCWFPKGES